MQGWVGDVVRRETRWSREGLWVGEGRREEEGPEWDGRWSRSRGGVMTVEGRAAVMSIVEATWG